MTSFIKYQKAQSAFYAASDLAAHNKNCKYSSGKLEKARKTLRSAYAEYKSSK